MNMSTLTDAITDRVPSSTAAASSLSSTFDEVADRLPDIDLSDLSRGARRTRRAVVRIVPGMSPSRLDEVRSRASGRWWIVAAAIVTAIAVVAVLRRRSDSEPDQRRDDWMTTPSGNSRHADRAEREPVTTHA